MSTIADNFLKLRKHIPQTVKIIAVTKTKPVDDIIQVYNLGYKIFGENKVQELVQKQEQMPKDIEWHMIGHLQSNKVKYIAPFVSMIHSVDSLSLLQEINKCAEKNNRTISCLLQMYIAKEESKFGLSMEEAKEILTSPAFKNLKNIEICGLMGMATYTIDDNVVYHEFCDLKNYFEEIKKEYFANSDKFTEMSMGMSGDYELAVKAGSTMVRIGSSIFGERL